MEVMVEATQWVVTYTRHKTQKRKVYHDGILVVKCCNSGQKKVLLYDDCGNLLENRFLRGDEKIECGETFEFDSVLVDIGDAMKKETHFLDITNQEKHMKIAGKGILPKRANNYRAFVKVSEEKSVQKTGLESMQRETNVRNSNTKVSISCRDLQPHNVPLLPFILQAPKIQAENSPSIVVEELADDFVMKYKLNEDQVKVLHFVAKWFTDSSSLNSRLLSPKPEICLVHGTFGSGKSYILAVITIFLTTVLKRQEENTPRILISAATNVAIDREIDRPPLLSGLPPLLFLDTCTHGSEIKDSSKSYNNPYEAKIACQLISMMLEHGIPGCEIGVIVLYKSQAYLVQEVLFQGCSFRRLDKNAINSTKAFEGQRVKRSVSKNHVAENHEKQGSSVSEIQISTVDAFQGMEKNIIILSCCRTNGLGFLSSPNRLNVALTRARHHLIVIGKASNLRSSPYWEKLLSSSVSSSGSYISMPTSGSEFILSWRQKHILRKDPSNIGDISLLSFDEKQGDASDGPDACILNAQSNQYKEESNILPLDAVGSTRTSDAFQMTVLPEGAAADNDSSMSFDIKKKRMRIEKSESRLIGKESAYMAKGYGNDLEMTYTEGSQTAKFVDVNESWIEDTTDCTNMKQDVALSECEQENDMNKAKPTKDDGSFEPGEVSNLALDCHFTPLIDAPYPSESNKSMILLRSGSTSDSRIVYDETSNDTEPSELLLTSEGEPTNGSANLVLKSVTIDVSEDSKSVFNRPDEATNGFGSNDMDRDDFAPTFNLGF